MTQSFDVLILGGGIVGAACARECALAGMKVGLAESGTPGGGASAAGMGHVVVMDDSPAQLALSCHGRALWRGLGSELPSNVEYEERGTLWVASDAEEMAEVFSKQQTYAGLRVSAEALDEKGVAEAEPNLRPGLAGGLLVPEDAIVYPPVAARYFLDVALDHGAALLRGLRAVKAADGTVRFHDGTLARAGAIVVATGTDTQLVPWIRVQPKKGHLVITDRYPGYVHHQIVELGYLKSAHEATGDSVAFNVQPRQTGQLLLGSSRQYGSSDLAVEADILRRMIDRACEFLPGVREMSGLRVWTGFRAATPDKLPLIGATRDPTVYVLMGFEGLGITNAPAAAELLADQLLGREPAIDPTPFLPQRLTREAVHA